MTLHLPSFTVHADQLRRCLASQRWIDHVAAHGPFHTAQELHTAADTAADALDDADWQEAFTAHPRIGDREVLRARLTPSAPTGGSGWEGGEQSGVDLLDESLLDELASANAAYEQQFGFIFLICATGLTGQQMLDALRTRITNDASTELAVAAGEQRKIMHLRIDKLITELGITSED